MTPFCLVFNGIGFFQNLNLYLNLNSGLCDSLLPGLYWKWFLSNAIHRAHSPHILNKPGTYLTQIYFNNNKQSYLAKRTNKINFQVNSLIQPFLYLGINEKLGKALIKKIFCRRDKNPSDANLDPASKISTMTIMP